MRFRRCNFSAAAILFAGLMIPARLAAQNTSSGIVTFDAPGAGVTSNFGTFPRSINDSGAVAGHYTDAERVNHGFLRTPQGVITTFDVPGAGTADGSGFGTFPESINDSGAIAGRYTDAHRVNHGFLRTPQGDIVTFDVPGAGTVGGTGFGTFPESINDAGAITGHYTDANYVNHGFLRTPRGNIITFDAPSAVRIPGSGCGTFPDGINDVGVITGYAEGSDVSRGFIRTPGGDFTTFDAPGASSLPGDGTFPRAINRKGAIVGNYSDVNREVNRGFLRSSGGEFTTFQAPGADTTQGSGNGTFPMSINDADAITGRYVDGNIVYHGFVRSPAGEFITFDAPDSSSSLDDGTFPRSINAKGAIVGNYSAADKEVNRGFLGRP